MTADDLVAGVELGGTKSVVVLARGREIVRRAQCPTTKPAETLGFLRAQLTDWMRTDRLAALGLASFGPIRLDPHATDYGTMLTTPKPGWTGANVGEQLARGLECPWQIETDVNAAAQAEWRWGAAQGHDVVCYLTIGTGLGGGVVINGLPLHGTLHPELGHLRLRRAPGDAFAGICPFHGDCIEGLISGPALSARFGCTISDVADNDPRWVTVAGDLAELLAAISLAFSPGKILLGGGVGLGRRALLNLARPILVERLAHYLPAVTDASVSTLVDFAGLGSDAGPLGAIAVGQLALLRAAATTNSSGLAP